MIVCYWSLMICLGMLPLSWLFERMLLIPATEDCDLLSHVPIVVIGDVSHHFTYLSVDVKKLYKVWRNIIWLKVFMSDNRPEQKSWGVGDIWLFHHVMHCLSKLRGLQLFFCRWAFGFSIHMTIGTFHKRTSGNLSILDLVSLKHSRMFENGTVSTRSYWCMSEACNRLSTY